MRKLELLIPAGSLDVLKTAVLYGADAVYLGGEAFGLRAKAKNFTNEEIKEGIAFAHERGVKVYITANIFAHNDDLAGVEEYFTELKEIKPDALIISDPGVFEIARRILPEMEIHISTQANNTTYGTFLFWYKQGAKRVVTARELSLKEIREIREHIPEDMEIESFIHGAMCISYSGRCLLSNFLTGRDANQGACTHPCRWKYAVAEETRPGEWMPVYENERGTYIFNSKDLCMIEYIPELIDAGIDSFKIEGRMKSPRYTAGVVRLYRKYVELYLKNGRKGYRVDPKDRKELLDLFDRGGQTLGYYTEHNGRDMVVCHEKPAFRQENRELYQYLDKTYVEAEVKEPVQGFARVCEGEPLQLTLQYEDPLTGESRMAGGIGAVVQTAVKQPMSKERIEKQLGKTGNTPYYFENLEVETGGSPFVPVQELNELRRSAFEQLTEEILRPYRREIPENRACGTGKGWQNPEEKNLEENNQTGSESEKTSPAQDVELTADLPVQSQKTLSENKKGNKTALYHIHVSVEHPSQLKVALSVPEVGAIYLDSAEFGAEQWNEWVSRCHEADKQCLLVMPHIFRDRAKEYFETHRSRLESAGFDGLVIRAWEELELVREWKISIPLVMDYGTYLMHHRAEAFVREMAPALSTRFTIPVAPTSPEVEARDRPDRELPVLGWNPGR